MKMKLFRKREWQRLLTAVVMLLAFGSLARAGADLVVVGAGYGHYEGTLPEGVDDVVRNLTGTESNDNNRCWVDVRNIGDKDISRNGENGDANAKLGIEFWFMKDENTRINSWNDMGIWSVPAQKTVRFYANGGTFNLFSGGNGTTVLNIEIGQGIIGIAKKQYKVNVTSDNNGVTFGTNNFDEENKPDYTVTIDGNEVGVTALKGVKEDGYVNEDFPEDFNCPFYLQQEHYYDFDKAPVGVYATRSVLWDRFEVDGKTIFKFKGISAYYRIQKVTKLTHRLDYNNNPIAPVDFTTHTFLKVEPLNETFAKTSTGWNVNYSERTKKFQNRDEVFPNFRNTNNDPVWGYGCLYIAGQGFGYGEYDKYEGWNARWKPDGSDDKYTMFDNHMWVPSPEKNLYKFRLKGGENISNDKTNGFNVKFFLNNYAKKFEGDINNGDQVKDWTKYYLVNSWRGGNVASTHPYANEWYSSDYPYLMHLAETRDFFEITENIKEDGKGPEAEQSPDWNNGNFQTRKIGFDSDTPALPEGYIFEITLDLREGSEYHSPTTWKAKDGVNGVQVTVERIKDAFALSYVNTAMVSYNGGVNQNEDIKYVIDTDGTTTCEVFLSKFNKTQKGDANKDVTKRLKLRDALRFDYGIPYAKQYNANADEVVKFKKLIINGALDSEDMQYLSWLAKNNKLITLDLSNAILPNGVIPGPQKVDVEPNETDFGGNSTVLEKVIMPTAGVKGIGKNAFKGCSGLTNMDEIVLATYGPIGDNAFQDCTNDNTTVVDVKNVTTIGEEAFRGCTQIVKFKVPATVEGATAPVVNYDVTYNGYGDAQPTDVGGLFKGITKKVSGTTNIEAEDFNTGNGTGYNRDGKTGSEGDDDNYRGDTNANYGIKNAVNSGGIYHSNNHGIGWNDGNNMYYNYSFYVEADGIYTLTAHIGSGSTGDSKKITATFDGTQNGLEFSFIGTSTWTPDCIQNVGNSKTFLLKKGWHYMNIAINTAGVELDYYTLNYVGVPNSSVSYAAITNAPYENAFKGIQPNNCEVEFEGSDDTSNWAAYRQQAGWMDLLTKTVSEDTPYNVVYQKHADVKATRTFKTKKWNSVVFPFTVNGKILKSATSEDGSLSEPFARAACLYDNNYGDPNFNDVKMRFVYLDNEYSFKEDGTEKIVAGTPFLLYVDDSKDAPADNVYVFKDVDTPAASNSVGLGYDDAKVIKMADPAGDNGITDYSFVGRVNYNKGDAAFTNKIYWVADSKYYWGTGVTMKNMRSWFEPKTESGARAIENLFGFVNDETTGISIVGADNNSNANGGIYSVSGRLISNDASSLSRLAKGVYIVNGKKVVVK